MYKNFLMLLILFVFTEQLAGQPLPRRGWMNVQTRELNDSLRNITKAQSGLYVVSVGEQGTGANLKMVPGDVIMTINGQPVNTKVALQNLTALMREGEVMNVQVMRKKKQKGLSGVVAPKPGEVSDDYEVHYDRVTMGDGYLSMIITKPKGEGPFPVILFIPGYMCYSLDNIGKHPYGQVTSRLTQAGYAVVRVEKSGEGSSVNTPDCREIGLQEEVKGFAAGLAKIYTLPFTDTANVFIFGHSLGAMQAPLVAKGHRVKGIIVEGTSGDSWFEYILAMFRFQNPIMGSDPAENETMIASSTPLLYRYLVEKEDPALLALNPVYDSILVAMMQYDGNSHIWDRHFTYWQELQDVNQAAAWRDTDARVLVFRGSGDLEAFSTEQHEGIVRTINHYHPGHGTFMLVRNCDHAFCKSDTPEESYKNGQVKGYHYSSFNPEVIRIVDEWIRSL